MYSAFCTAVNLAVFSVAAAQPPAPPACDPQLAALFAPPHPQLGRYEVCTSPRPLTALAPPGWKVESVGPLDAFGAAVAVDRHRVARLYGGRRAAVARGWRRQDGGIESVTFISPHPNRALTALDPGTLVIRYFVPTAP